MALASGIRPFRFLPLLALASWIMTPAAFAAGTVGDAYITSDASDIVRAYDGTAGVFLGNHCSSVNAIGQLGIHFGVTNGRFLVGSFNGGVDEFNATTGAYIKTYSPGGGWQWAGIYAPNGNVYIGSMTTNDVREYDVNTGAFVGILTNVFQPADMQYGPNGNLYICSFNGQHVREVHPVSGAPINQFFLPVDTQPNDVAFLPNGNILVTAMGTNKVYVFDSGLTLIAAFSGAGWLRPHGIDIGPVDGNIYVVDGVTTQVHVFDPITFTELNPAWRNPNTGDKIVDIEFRRDEQVVPVEPSTWGRIKNLFEE